MAMKRKRKSSLINKNHENDIVTLFEFEVSITTFQLPDGRWYPNIHMLSMGEKDNERGVAVCLSLDLVYKTPEDALIRGVRIAHAMNANVRESDVFVIHRWVDDNAPTYPTEYLRLFDDGSSLH